MKAKAMFWLSLSAAIGLLWYWLIGCLAYDAFHMACLPAIGKAAGIAAFFTTLVTGGMCCSSGSHLERISQEAARGVFDED